jgi:multimeric flavodoxin WrbA
MNIIVLNGSPKGELSITMQFIAYLANSYPQHEFQIVHIAQKINKLEKNQDAFLQVIDQVRASDAVIWGFPLYILHVHANYKRFIELIFERSVQDAFAGKYTASVSTSIHFFDHTANNYIRGICDDLGMHFVDTHSPGMNDLMQETGRKSLLQFGQAFFDAVENQVPTQRLYAPLLPHEFSYLSQSPASGITTGGKKVVILHDENDADSNLFRMVQRCQAAFTGDVQVFNIRQLDIKGSCLGCLECGGNYQCAYIGKDEYIDFYKTQVMKADVLVYAGKMVDRYLSARWKMFFDRIFFNTHTPVLQNKQVALVISGALSQVPNLMEIFQGFFEFQGANISGVVTDEYCNSAELDQRIDQLMWQSLAYSHAGYVRPQSFLGVAGMKLFRDDIYGRLRTVFAADHRAYRRMGFYKTFPQSQVGVILLNTFVAPIVNLPPIRKKFDKMIKEQMVRGSQTMAANAGIKSLQE